MQAPGSEPRCGARTHKPRDHDLSQSWTLHRLSHPGAPIFEDLNALRMDGVPWEKGKRAMQMISLALHNNHLR